MGQGRRTHRQAAPFALPAGQAFAAPAGLATDEAFGSGRQVPLAPVVDGTDVLQIPTRRVRRSLPAVGQRPVLTLGVHVVIADCPKQHPTTVSIAISSTNRMGRVIARRYQLNSNKNSMERTTHQYLCEKRLIIQ